VWRFFHITDRHAWRPSTYLTNEGFSVARIEKIGLLLWFVPMGWDYVSELRPSRGLLSPIRRYTSMDSRWIVTRENEELGEEPVPVPLCPPQISHGLTRREPGPPRRCAILQYILEKYYLRLYIYLSHWPWCLSIADTNLSFLRAEGLSIGLGKIPARNSI
jgi:hypothetical protein